MNIIDTQRVLFVVLLLVLSISFSDAGFSNEKNRHKFKVFDSTLYENKPDFSVYGIRRVKIVYPNEIWIDGGNNKVPPSDKIIKESASRILRKIDASVEYICLDIESWPVVGNIKRVEKYKSFFIDLIKHYKTEMPGKKIGLYGILPIRNYYDAINLDSPGYYKWKSSVEDLADIAKEVDVIFPSLYTFTTNRTNWVKYAKSNIEAAKQFNKPIIPLIWPQYHQSNKILGLQFIPESFWELQLETVASYADGVIIWGGWDTKNRRRYKWNENSKWWKVLKRFIKNLD